MRLLCSKCCASENGILKVHPGSDDDKANEETSFLSTPTEPDAAFRPAKPISPKAGNKVDVGEVKRFLPQATPAVATQSQIHPIILDLSYSPRRGCTGGKGAASICTLAMEEEGGHYREQPVSMLSGSSGCTILLLVCIVGLFGLALIAVFALPDPTEPPAVRPAQPTGFGSPAPSPRTPSATSEATQLLPFAAAAATSAAQQRRSAEAQAVAAILQQSTASPSVLLASDDENHDCSLESESEDIDKWLHAKRVWCCDKWGRGCPSMFAQAPPRLRTRTA